MPGLKSNTITYVFEGDTLNLEQAIQRVRKMMKGTVTTLKQQEGGMTAYQKDQYNQLLSLMKVIKELNGKTRKLTEAEQKHLNSAMRRALQLSSSLYKASLREKDRIRKRDLHKSEKAAKKEEAYQDALEEARSPEAQVRAHSQLQQLARLRGFMNPDDPTEKEALHNLDNVISKYNEARQAYDAGTGSMDRLAAATVELDTKYKELASSLNRLSSEQNKANHGEGKSSFIQYVLGKTKSLAVYKTIKAIMAKIAQAINDSFAKIAQRNTRFNDAMSRITSSFQLMADKIATVLAPALELIVPLLESTADVVGKVTDKIAEMLSAVAGNDEWAKATYQVKDYIAAVKKVKQPEGIDELNKLNDDQNNIVNVNVDTKFKGLKALGEELKSIFDLISSVLGPVLTPLMDLLGVVFQLVGSITTALQPLFDLIGAVLGVLAGAIGGVLTFLITNILQPIVTWLAYIIEHLELLIPLIISLLALFAATHWSAFVTTLNALAMGFLHVAVAIGKAVASLVVWVAKTVVAMAKSAAMAIANMWEAMTWWQKAIAIIAAAGIGGIVVAGIVMAATASANTAAQNNLNSDLGMAAMATGGIVAAPTIALLGEGKYPEAVVPLGDSPQFKGMKEGIAEEVVKSLNINVNGGKGSDRPVVLQIDGRTIARAIWPSLVETQHQVGVKIK